MGVSILETIILVLGRYRVFGYLGLQGKGQKPNAQARPAEENPVLHAWLLHNTGVGALWEPQRPNKHTARTFRSEPKTGGIRKKKKKKKKKKLFAGSLCLLSSFRPGYS